MGRENEKNRKDNLNTPELLAVTFPPKDNLCRYCQHVLPPIKSGKLTFEMNTNGFCLKYRREDNDPKPYDVLWEQSIDCDRFEPTDSSDDIEAFIAFMEEHS